MKPGRESMRTRAPGAMAARSLATVLAAVCFFEAFRRLGFAEVFLFIGLMPILSALMARPVLGEAVSPASWGALMAGLLGVICLFPQGISALSAGHAIALAAAVCGTLSIVLSRRIAAVESNALAQVFYPNLAILLSMGAVLPWVWVPMAWADAGWAVVYGVLLFAARWLLVLALRDLAAHAVTTLMKLQFIWMVGIGAAVFGEWPGANVFLGAAIVIGSGLFLVYDDQLRGKPAKARATATAARRAALVRGA
jgi:drug/metabolite transporter (DMT)-like permease